MSTIEIYNTVESCVNCYYAKEDGYKCYRYPPKQYEAHGTTSYYEITFPTNWCGEWRETREQTAKRNKETSRLLERMAGYGTGQIPKGTTPYD